MESGRIEVASKDMASVAIADREKGELHSGRSVPRSVGFLPPVEAQLGEVSPEEASQQTGSFVSEVAANISAGAWKKGHEVGFQPAQEDCGRIHEANIPYGVVKVVEETRKALEQVG